jgi:hypothetical protein
MNVLEKSRVGVLIYVPCFILTLETYLSYMKIFMFSLVLIGISLDDTLN